MSGLIQQEPCARIRIVAMSEEDERVEVHPSEENKKRFLRLIDFGRLY